MKKWYVLFVILFIIIGIVIGIYFFNNNKNNNIKISDNDNYNASRTDTNTSENVITNETNNTNDTTTDTTTSKKEISSYTTKIYTKDSDRQNNISIACSALNGTTVKKGETFSFSNTVGKATSNKGYEKADVFVDGDIKQALGGGMCQVSTTLYNAVRSVSKLDITERHEHSNDVPYIAEGKDAAVSYGTYDFKFVNNTGNDIKIGAKNTKNKVTIKLYRISKN